jgi:hypothetical protein
VDAAAHANAQLIPLHLVLARKVDAAMIDRFTVAGFGKTKPSRFAELFDRMSDSSEVNVRFIAARAVLVVWLEYVAAWARGNNDFWVNVISHTGIQGVSPHGDDDDPTVVPLEGGFWWAFSEEIATTPKLSLAAANFQVRLGQLRQAIERTLLVPENADIYLREGFGRLKPEAFRAAIDKCTKKWELPVSKAIPRVIVSEFVYWLAESALSPDYWRDLDERAVCRRRVRTTTGQSKLKWLPPGAVARLENKLRAHVI